MSSGSCRKLSKSIPLGGRFRNRRGRGGVRLGLGRFRLRTRNGMDRRVHRAPSADAARPGSRTDEASHAADHSRLFTTRRSRWRHQHVYARRVRRHFDERVLSGILGSNGRTCFSCHQPQSGWGMSVRSVRDDFDDTSGYAPIFRQTLPCSPYAPILSQCIVFSPNNLGEALQGIGSIHCFDFIGQFSQVILSGRDIHDQLFAECYISFIKGYVHCSSLMLEEMPCAGHF